MSKREPGRLRLRLAVLLRKDLGIVVDPYDLWTQDGAYRSHHWDLACWGAHNCKFEPETAERLKFWHEFHISSWDTMTESCRYRLALVSDPNQERSLLEISITEKR